MITIIDDETQRASIFTIHIGKGKIILETEILTKTVIIIDNDKIPKNCWLHY